MNIVHFFLIMLLTLGCSSAKNTIWQGNSIEGKTIAIDTGHMVFEDRMGFLSDTLKRELHSHLLDSLMNELLDKTISGYRALSEKNVKYTSRPENADFSIIIDSLILEKGFTMNITRPGPVYHVQLFTSVTLAEQKEEGSSYSGSANFAEMVGGDKAFHQPDEEERQKESYQLKTLDAAIRKAMSKAFQDYLGLKNYM